MNDEKAKHNLFYSTWVESKQMIEDSDAVIVALGSVEEHGYHLPMGTDTIITDALVKDLCDRFRLCCYPCTTFGQVWSAKGFPGTVSIRSEVLKSYLKEAVNSVLNAGAKKVILYSFHNGNYQTMWETARELYQETEQENVYVLHTQDAAKVAGEVLQTQPWNGKVWHAGELETSLMLFLQEELVDMSKATAEFPTKPSTYELKPTPWNKFCESGAFGDSKAATKEKGEAAYQKILEGLSDAISIIISEDVGKHA